MAEQTPKLTQFLIKRNPAMTQKEFSDHWYHKHGAIVTPYFLSFGFEYYAQTHGPLSTTNSDFQADCSHFDGAAESIKAPQPVTTEPAWKKAYYDEVIVVDERRFLVSDALMHYKIAPGGSILGEKKVVIQDGKAVIDIPEDVMEVWKEYEARGKNEAEGQ